ncbi:DUF2617 family protein [Actinomadura vinacea]|uniref:DUF2617 family protein n=1 Tax=Actinomadura vinacea TaxID=115336 RepID=A0ABN3J448_9ACTN
MLTSLDTPYADSRADALSFALGLARLDALAVLTVPAVPSVELRLLGASHQVLVGSFCETVACLPGGHDPLPGRFRTTTGGWDYDFTATTVAHDGDAAFRRTVDELRDRLADRTDALTGTFPGSPHAVTALAIAAGTPPGELGWRTWHAYPQTREIVMTRSRLVSET